MEQTVVGIFCLFRGRGEGGLYTKFVRWSAREGWKGKWERIINGCYGVLRTKILLKHLFIGIHLSV